MPLRLSRRASRDLDELYNYGLDRWGQTQADSYLAAFWREADFIERYPNASRLRHEVSPPVRARRIKAHLIIYESLGDEVIILRIAHARSDWLHAAH